MISVNYLKKECAIVLISNSKYFFALCTFLINLKSFFSRYDSIVIYTDFLASDQLDVLIRLVGKDRLIIKKYLKKDFLAEYKLNEENNFFLTRFSHLVVTKFKFFELLKDFRKIIFFDTDMIIRSNIDDLLYGEYNIAAAINEDNIYDRVRRYASDKPKVRDFLESIKNTELERTYKNAKTVNGGLFVINDNFDYEKALRLANSFVTDYFGIHPYLFDELLFGYLIEKMNLNCHALDRTVYNVLPYSVAHNSKIVHLYSTHKPWNNKYAQLLYPEWLLNYKLYLEYGGTESPDVHIFNIGSEYRNFEQKDRCITNMEFWSPHIIDIISKLHENLYYRFDISRHYIQFFIRKYPRHIHYEILRRGDKVYIALHNEGKEKDDRTIKIFEQVAKKLKCEHSNSIEVLVKNDLVDEFVYFVNSTINLFEK